MVREVMTSAAVLAVTMILIVSELLILDRGRKRGERLWRQAAIRPVFQPPCCGFRYF